jgi:prepilin-type N-terminal cleavage/methylation domain-containing protein
MTMRGFTLIELLIVILILAALAGLTVIGMGNIVHQARVQRSAFAYVQTITLAKEMALANRLVYSLSVNTAKAPGDTSAGLCPLSMPTTDRYYAELSGNGWQTVTNFSGPQLGHTATTPAAMWSDKPTDQWYALMGPWQDANGTWWQARGGLPRVWKTTLLRTGEDGTAGNGADQIGGCFGPANSNPAVPLTCLLYTSPSPRDH